MEKIEELRMARVIAWNEVARLSMALKAAEAKAKEKDALWEAAKTEKEINERGGGQ